MSEPGNADLFKSRLAQLKKVLERDAKIAENLFYAALQLDKNKELKSGVQEIIDKHKMKAKKGYLFLPDDEKDRPAAVKALLKDSFDFLLKAFNVDKSSLVQRKASEPKVHALQLFELQSTLEAQAIAQSHAFESTMQDLDSIDTSTPLEQTVIVAPPSDGGEAEIDALAVAKLLAPKDLPAPPKPPVQPVVVSKLVITEQITGVKEPGQKPAVIVLSPGPSSTKKVIPLPPKVSLEGKVAVPLADPLKAKVTTVIPAPVIKPSHVATAVPVTQLIPKSNAITKPAPAPASSPVPPLPVSYEYYVCNRCGEETSKSVIRQIGAFLECPKCKFNFSRAEATIIQKTPPEPERTNQSGSEEIKKPFELFTNKQPGEDESLVRPSLLFADREKETQPTEKKAISAKVVEGIRPKSRPVPSDRLVRPSEFLGIMDEHVSVEEPASVIKRPVDARVAEAEKIVRQEASEYFDDQESLKQHSLPVTEDTKKIAQAPANEYFDEAKDVPVTKQIPKSPTPVGEATMAPVEKHSPGDACPKCGATKYSRIQDRNKVISYNPLMYGYKKKCTACLFEFD